MPDENDALDGILSAAPRRVDDARMERASHDLSAWAESRVARRRTMRLRLGVFGLLGVVLAGGAAVTATAVGTEFPHNGRYPDAHWVHVASNGQTCDLWTRVSPDIERGATEADGAAYLRAALGEIEITEIDLKEALDEYLPAPGASTGQTEGMALVSYVTRHLLPDRLLDGRTPDVVIESWVDCDEAAG